MRAHLEEIVGATGDIEGTGALIIRHPEELLIHPERKFFISQFGFEFVVFDKYPDKK